MLNKAASSLNYKHIPDTLLKNRKFSKAIEKFSALKRLSVKVIITFTGEENTYKTLTEKSKALNVSRTALSKAIVSGNKLKGIYLISSNKSV